MSSIISVNTTRTNKDIIDLTKKIDKLKSDFNIYKDENQYKIYNKNVRIKEKGKYHYELKTIITDYDKKDFI